LICGDETIQKLNAQYRSKDEATDVLSFTLGEFITEGEERRWLPGDIAISLDTLRENAQYFQIDADEELRRLLIHGILHLDGMDHQSNEANEPMIILQENLLKKLKGERILPAGDAA
jgi:probable rRNA maturation factor